MKSCSIISLLAGILVATSCIKPCDLELGTGGSKMSNTLCVAANARIIRNELSFSAAVAPVRSLWSGTADFEYYPLDSLVLELNVDGIIYSSDSLVKDGKFGSGKGFIIDNIPIVGDTFEVEMRIWDKAGNYDAASASGKTLSRPEMQVQVFATLSEDESFMPISYEEAGHLSWRNLRCPDSLYLAKIIVDPLEEGLHYYLIAVEFDFCPYIPWRYEIEKGHVLDETKLTKIGEVPFTGDNEHFFDSRITSSISGFPAYFSNIFFCDGVGEESRDITIQFVNPALKLYKKRAGKDDHFSTNFGSNAQAPFHLYLCELSAESYEYYKTIQYQVCSSGSIFDAQSSIRIPSNIEGGLGYFSIHNMQEFFYVDLTRYNQPCYI